MHQHSPTLEAGAETIAYPRMVPITLMACVTKVMAITNATARVPAGPDQARFPGQDRRRGGLAEPQKDTIRRAQCLGY